MIKVFTPNSVSILGLLLFSSLTLEASEWLDASRGEGKSRIEYAELNDDYLSKHAVRKTVDPNHTSYSALWVYEMPDGAVVECTRGVINDNFFYSCTER